MTTDKSLETRYRRSKILNVVLAVASVFLLVVVVAQTTSNTSSENAESTTAGEASTGLERRDSDDPMAIGDVDAPVVMIEWTDMRCPYCAQFSRETLPAIVDEYVTPGDVRVEVRDVAFFGEQSELASVAARAAGNQDKFAEYMQAVYEAAPDGGHPDLPRDRLLAFAEQIDIPDLERFDRDLDDPTLLNAVRESTTSAQKLGVNSVPFFVLGNKALSGAQPIDVFRNVLDEALTERE